MAGLLQIGGRFTSPCGEPDAVAEDFQAQYIPGDLARAAMLTVARSPEEFVRPGREVAGIAYSTLRPILDDVPRYLHWLGSQGYLGTLHPWAAIVAADLNRRIRWRRCGPPRGSGRLLWMCEQMADPVRADQQVPAMWSAARDRGLGNPDWLTLTPPVGNRLDESSYANLLRERVSGSELRSGPAGISARPAPGRVIARWDAAGYRTETAQRTHLPVESLTGREEARSQLKGAALFSWRGDYRATGWLASYSAVADSYVQ